MIVGKVENGIVVEAFLVDEIPEHMQTWPQLPDHVGKGWKLEGANWLAPDTRPERRAIATLPKKAFIKGAVGLGILTIGEGALLAKGEIPQKWVTVLQAGGISKEMAEIEFSGIEVHRNDPIVQFLAARPEIGEAKADELFGIV